MDQEATWCPAQGLPGGRKFCCDQAREAPLNPVVPHLVGGPEVTTMLGPSYPCWSTTASPRAPVKVSRLTAAQGRQCGGPTWTSVWDKVFHQGQHCIAGEATILLHLFFGSEQGQGAPQFSQPACNRKTPCMYPKPLKYRIPTFSFYPRSIIRSGHSQQEDPHVHTRLCFTTVLRPVHC